MCYYKCFRYSSQKEWQRKEQLYLKIIEYFEKDKQWESAIPLCKELSDLYEKRVFDYAKLSGILCKQASLFEKVISCNEDGLRFDPEYFRVGFYGQGFPLFLRVRIGWVKILKTYRMRLNRPRSVYSLFPFLGPDFELAKTHTKTQPISMKLPIHVSHVLMHLKIT